MKADQLLWITMPGQREPVWHREREIAEHLLPLLHLEITRKREPHASEILLLVRRAQSDQPPRLAIWQRAEEDGIDHAEERDVRADPEPEADDGNEREPGRFHELTDGVAQIRTHGDLRDILSQGRARRIVLAQPGTITVLNGVTAPPARRGGTLEDY